MADELHSVTVEWVEGVAVLLLAGEHDMMSAPDVEACATVALMADAVGLVVDLTEATFIDSSIINLLLRLDRGERARGRRVVVTVGEDGPPRRALEITGLTERLDCVTSREEAVAGARSTT